MPFWVLDGFAKINASALEGMAGTTGLEPAASAVTGETDRIDSELSTTRELTRYS
jgi:hypothetical protein